MITFDFRAMMFKRVEMKRDMVMNLGHPTSSKLMEGMSRRAKKSFSKRTSFVSHIRSVGRQLMVKVKKVFFQRMRSTATLWWIIGKAMNMMIDGVNSPSGFWVVTWIRFGRVRMI